MLDLALIRAEPARVKAALARRGVAPEAVDTILDLDSRAAARTEARESLRQRRRRVSEEVARLRRLGADTSDLEALGRRTGDELAAVEAQAADLQDRRNHALLALPNLPKTDVPDEPPAPDAGPAPPSHAHDADAGESVPAEDAQKARQAASAPAAAGAGYAQASPISPPWLKPFPPLPHWNLLAILGLAAPAEIPGLGRGFGVWRDRGARLLRALVNFMLDVHTREFGCEEVRVPSLTTRGALTWSAHLPTLEGKMYALAPDDAAGAAAPPLPGHDAAAGEAMPGGNAPQAGRPTDSTSAGRDRPRRPPATDLLLAPRAEPNLAALYAGQTLSAASLPIRLVAAATAFRREAGSAGAESRGLIRLHEFDTVELYTLCRPDQDEEELQRAVRAAETILERLQVPHRRRLRAAPLLSHAAAKTVDLEVWAPGLPGGPDAPAPSPRPDKGGRAASATEGGAAAGRGRWLPVAAISTFTDYQARRTATRFRDAAGHARLVHTVGGAAVALPHLVAAILENGQDSGGTVRFPEALAPYIGEA
jgi:seryl-tRNA synthetase